MDINTMIKVKIAIDETCPPRYMQGLGEMESVYYTTGIIRVLENFLWDDLTVGEIAELKNYVWDKREGE